MGTNSRSRGKRTVEAGASREQRQTRESPATEERRARILYLQDTLAVCPVDIRARYELATRLENIGRSDEALFNWRAILASQPNSLMAREAVVRCRQQIGRILGGMTGETQSTDAGQC